MKLTDQLNKDAENAAGKAEANDFLTDAVIEQTPDELVSVTGGNSIFRPVGNGIKHSLQPKVRCKVCGHLRNSGEGVKNCCTYCENKDPNKFEIFPFVAQSYGEFVDH